MEKSFFKGRCFDSYSQIENFMNFNEITKEQIVSITNDSTYHGNGRFKRYVSLYCYVTKDFKYDFYTELPEERQQHILNRFIKLQEKYNRYSFKWDDYDYEETVFLKFNNVIFPYKNEDEPKNIIEFYTLLLKLNPNERIPYWDKFHEMKE